MRLKCLSLAGDNLYLSTGGGVLVMDISEPASPHVLGSAATVGYGGCVTVARSPESPDWIYITDRTYSYPYWNTHLRVLPIQCGEVSAVSDEPLPGTSAGLFTVAASPNPFNPRTTIHYEVSTTGPVRLGIFDMRGRLVTTLVDEVVPAAGYEVVWNGRDSQGRDVPSGVYLSRLEAGGRVVHGRMALVR